MEITSLGQLEKLRQELANKGFYQSHKDTVVCRFHYDDIAVDVMATEEVGWAPANKWVKPGFAHLKTIELEPALEIHILSLPYFLTSKFEAFKNRGINDPRMSKDFEDIVTVIDNNSQIVSEVLSAQEDAKTFLIQQFNHFLTQLERFYPEK